MTDPHNRSDYDSASVPMRSVEDSIPVDGTATDSVLGDAPMVETTTRADTVTASNVESANKYQQASSGSADGVRSPIELYEERLVTQTQRIKTGEVKISKRIVTQTASADIPVTKEKIVIEIESIYTGETRIDIGEAQTAEDGSIRMDIYEEQALSCRRIVPYQNVSVRKEVVTDVVTTQETLRREELDVVTERAAASGDPLVEERQS